MPCIESYVRVDLRTVSFSVPPQEILTRDSVTVSVDAVVYYRIMNATVRCADWITLFLQSHGRSFAVWPTWRMPTIPPVCWPKQQCATCWAQKRCPRFSPIGTQLPWSGQMGMEHLPQSSYFSRPCNPSLMKPLIPGASKWSALKCECRRGKGKSPDCP